MKTGLTGLENGIVQALGIVTALRLYVDCAQEFAGLGIGLWFLDHVRFWD